MDYRDVKKEYWDSQRQGEGPFHLSTLKQVMERTGPRKPKHGDHWGQWRLNRKNNTLEHTGGGGGYWIDLDGMKTSAQCLDWIFQVYKKRWHTRDDAHALLDAIQDLINPQATLCSFGVERNGWKKKAG
jgi:hypothetical protein